MSEMPPTQLVLCKTDSIDILLDELSDDGILERGPATSVNTMSEPTTTEKKRLEEHTQCKTSGHDVKSQICARTSFLQKTKQLALRILTQEPKPDIRQIADVNGLDTLQPQSSATTAGGKRTTAGKKRSRSR